MGGGMTNEETLEYYKKELAKSRCKHDQQVFRGLVRKYQKLVDEGKGNEESKTNK
jgi:aspartate/glutamate racemase